MVTFTEVDRVAVMFLADIWLLLRGQQVEIQIDPRTLERAQERGTNKTEIMEVINTGFPYSSQIRTVSIFMT